MATFDKDTARKMWEWAHHKPVSREQAIKHWLASVDGRVGWCEFMRRNFEHNKKRLSAEGWVQVTDSKGGTHWEKPAEEPDSEGRQKEIEWLRDLWNIGREPMADIAILPSWVMERWEIENDIKKRETDWLEEHVTKAEEPSGTQ